VVIYKYYTYNNKHTGRNNPMIPERYQFVVDNN